MAFRTAFIAHAPEADPEKNRCTIEMEKYRLEVRIVSNQEQALEVCRKLAEEGLDSILLCPGFTHADVAEIAATVGSGIGVTVARGDAPSNRAAMEVIAREWG